MAQECSRTDICCLVGKGGDPAAHGDQTHGLAEPRQMCAVGALHGALVCCPAIPVGPHREDPGAVVFHEDTVELRVIDDTSFEGWYAGRC